MDLYIFITIDSHYISFFTAWTQNTTAFAKAFIFVDCVKQLSNEP